MKRLCVFCGSRTGTGSVYIDAARELGRVMVERGYGLVFGGGHVGLMGVVADTVLAGNGEVIGVIPQGLVDRELAHPRCTQLHVTRGMHERKA
ncbi:MAG TPA: LOG family protein, partial [Gemmataceae bacterium]|nr:LOG family protein [Gemmataceae bacterium]